MLTEIGPVEIEVPRDTDATVAPTDTEGTTDDGDVIRVSDRGTARWPSHS
ncbi:hypothetical protein Rhow_001228 [Rhodococcus wratislaviensis]|uniref:Uncharacterized protein n=1 Tax=Rhodococcus wratislaviensis TaxID=44752 RepID=A0A402C3M2_RHOWR|nr:hypothetical protein Rhow_001228 [Rhodococcus wratislaviensis]